MIFHGLHSCAPRRGVLYDDAIDRVFNFKIPTYPLILLITTLQLAYKIDMDLKGKSF